MDHPFRLEDPYSEAVCMGYNHLIIIIGSNNMDAAQIILTLITKMELCIVPYFIKQQ